jgi:putative DNA primase/helicase
MAHAARAVIAERQARQLWPERAPRSEDDPPLPVRTPLAEPEPWPEPVDAAQLLTDIARLIERHLYLPEHGATLLALWALHAWVPAAGAISPRLALTSAEAQSGKSTALRLLSALTPRPLLAMHARAVPLIRTIDFLAPTLLFDDAERWVWPNRVLRATLVAGAAADAKFLRESKNPFEMPALSCFAPCAFTVSGRIPLDVARRAITLTLRPALGQEQRPRFNPRSAEAEPLIAQAVRWSRDAAATLSETQPEPTNLPRGQRELWQPLLAIAHIAGADWPERADAAALALGTVADTRSLGIELLDDIRIAYGHEFERLPTLELIKMLTANLERPWARMANGRELSPRDLAQMLAPFGIHPRYMRFADGLARGYLARDFADAFARYLGPRVYTPLEDM